MGEGASRTREIEGESSKTGGGGGTSSKNWGGGGGKMKLGVMYVYEEGK